MSETRLRFGSTYIEVGSNEDFPLALNIGIADIADISKRKGTYSQTFKVPATNGNNTAFKHLWQDQIEDDNITGVVYGRNTSELEHNGISWDRGYAKVGSVLKDSQPLEYELTYFGSNADWFSRVGDSKLNELDTTTTATFDKAGVLAAASGSLDWVYPLINYGGWVSAAFPLGTTGVPFGVSTHDFRPAMRISAIIDKIFENVGYTVESNFMTSPECTGTVYLAGEFNHRLDYDFEVSSASPAIDATASFNRGFVVIPGSIASNADALDEMRYFGTFTEIIDDDNVVSGTFSTGVTPSSQININFSTTNVTGLNFEPNLDRSFRFNISFDYELTGTTYNPVETERLFIEIRETNTDTLVYLHQFGLGIDNRTYSGIGDVYVGSTTGTFGTQITDFVSFDATGNYAIGLSTRRYINGQANAGGGSADAVFNVSNVNIEGYSAFAVKLGDTYEPYSTLGEEKQIDFLSKVAKTFNLYFDTDTHTRKVLIEPRNDWQDVAGTTQTGYYKGIDEAVDWSDKLDLSEGIAIKYLSEYKDELEFKWEDVADHYPERWEEQFKYQPFRQLYKFPNEYNAGRTTIEQGYVPTINKYEDGKLNNGVEAYVQMPFILDDYPEDAKRQQDCEPRLLHYEWTNEADYLLRPRAWVYFDDTATSDVSGTDPTNSFEISSNYDNYVSVPKAWVVNYDDTTKFQLSWASYGDGTGLADRYYNETVRDLRNRTIYEASFRLRPSDILPFMQADGFRKPVHINGVYYRVNKIKGYKPQMEDSTKVELVKIVSRDKVDFGSENINELINLE
jgi:hypothetical protein